MKELMEDKDHVVDVLDGREHGGMSRLKLRQISLNWTLSRSETDS